MIVLPQIKSVPEYIQCLDHKAKLAAEKYKTAEIEIINILQQLDESKGYSYYNCASLFEYAHQRLELGEDIAYRFIRIARRSVLVPALKQAMIDKAITSTKAKTICSVITEDNQDQWLDMAKKFSKQRLEKEVAKVCPKEAVKEKVKYVSDTRLELTAGLNIEDEKLLKRAQEICSQRLGKPADKGMTITDALKYYVEQLDPIEKAKRSQKKEEKKKLQLVPSTVTRPEQLNLLNAKTLEPRRKMLTPKQKTEALARDGAQCTCIVSNDGKRCQNRTFLDVHHIVPVSCGGTDELRNLATLCRNHHQILHHLMG